ncbi:MAG: hypothetical protein DMG39_27870 [Acidobacteria bacterium]|nr:MAG: hypothetical protein DMG39_27870 [Acidobacteriota bacterium]
MSESWDTEIENYPPCLAKVNQCADSRRLNPPSNTAQAKKPVSIRGRNENHNHDLKNLFNTRHYCWIVHSEVGPLPGMLYCEARRAARRDARGRYVPLSEQNPNQWSLPLIEEAEHHLAEAFKHGRVGRFQLEAAIQSVHAERAHTGRTDWAAIVPFYEQLLRISPTLGTRAGYAAALAEANGPAAGLAVLESIDAEAVSHYQPYWAVRAHLLQKLGNTAQASEAYDRAVGLAEDPAEREFLLHKRG